MHREKMNVQDARRDIIDEQQEMPVDIQAEAPVSPVAEAREADLEMARAKSESADAADLVAVKERLGMLGGEEGDSSMEMSIAQRKSEIEEQLSVLTLEKLTNVVVANSFEEESEAERRNAVIEGKERDLAHALENLELSERQSLVARQAFASPHERVMGTHEARQTSALGGGINKTEFIALKDDGSVVFKPVSGEVFAGEHFNAHVKPGTYYKRERAAYLVSEFFGFKLVPPTILRELNGEVGSVQEFIPDTEPGFKLTTRDRSSIFENVNVIGKRRDKKYEEALAKLSVFDHLIWNIDRHGGNFLLKEGNVYAIDNGFAFNKRGDEDSLRWRAANALSGSPDKEVPADVLARLSEFSSRPEVEQEFRAQMDGLLSAEEIDALVFRARGVATNLAKKSMPTRMGWRIRFNA